MIFFIIGVVATLFALAVLLLAEATNVSAVQTRCSKCKGRTP